MRSTLKNIAAAMSLFIFLALFAGSAFSQEETVEKVLSYKFAQYFSNKDLDGMASLFNDGITVYDPGKITKGKENFLNLLKSNFDKTNTIIFRVLHVYQEGNTTIVEFKLSFDNETYNGVDIIVWRDNKMDEIRCFYYLADIKK